MLKRYIPFAHAKSIFDITNNFYIKNNFKYVLCDLDNTLDGCNVSLPSKRVFELKKRLDSAGIQLIVASNNNSNRVKLYCAALGVNHLSSAGKPFKRGVLKFLNKMKININDVIIIGDQTVTDIACANKCNIKAVLTDKIVEKDQLWTKLFNRKFDNIHRRGLAKNNLLVEWEERQ